MMSVELKLKQACGSVGSLQIVLINRFCIFFLYKTVNCNMQTARGQAGLGI
jgi:hypothetical protein